MFHFPEALSSRSPRSKDARRYLKRAALFGAGIALLWVALKVVPAGAPSTSSDVYSDDAGTVAMSPTSSITLFTPGNLAAVLLLAGGVAVAVYLRRRTRSDERSVPILNLGELAIGPSQSLRLIRCADEVLLLGIASGQISLLRTYPPDEFSSPPSNHLASQQIGRRGGLDVPAEANSVNGGAGTNRATTTIHGSHFSDVLREFSGRFAAGHQNGITP